MPSAFEQVTRTKVDSMNIEMRHGFDRIDKALKEINEKQTELFNHMSDRPTKSTARFVNFLVALSTALVTVVATLIAAWMAG